IDRFLAARLNEVISRDMAAGHGDVDFFRDVQPILEARCASCHRGAKAQGALRLESLQLAQKGGESYGPAIVPGNPEASALLARAGSTDPDERMPPKGEPLSADQVSLLKRWIQ